MEGLKRFSIPLPRRRENQKQILGGLLSNNLNPFLNNLSILECNRTMMNGNRLRKALTCLLQCRRKPRKQAKSALHQEVQEFNHSDQMSMEQLIKIVLNLQEEVKKLRKDNEKLIQPLNLAEGIESRFMPKKENQRFLKLITKLEQTILKLASEENCWITDSEKQKINCKLLRKIKAKLELQKWKSKSKKIKQNKENNQKSKRNVSAVEAFDIFSEVLEILIEIKKLLEKKGRRKNQKNVLQLGWFNIQNQDGTVSSKRKENLKKSDFPISLKLDDPSIYIQQQGA